MTDALTANLWAWTVPNNARAILDQLHRILASCRGGNETLSRMLRLKMAQIQDQEPLLLEPSPRIQEVFDHTENPTSPNSGVGTDGEPIPTSSSFVASRSIEGNTIELSPELVNNAGPNLGRDTQLAPHIIDPELTRTLTNTLDLYGQLQSFDGSFNHFQAFDTMDAFLPNNETSQTPRAT